MNPAAFIKFHGRFRCCCLLVVQATVAVATPDFGWAQSDKTFADPTVQQIEGWTVKIDPEVLADKNRVESQRCLKALANHLQRVTYIVSPERVKQLQAFGIWIHWNHELTNMQYHPGRGWLLSKGYDPRLVKHIHIPRAKILLERKQWAKHPYAILHELAHAYHDQKLSFDYQPIVKAFDHMKRSGSYEKTLAHTGKKTRHYALSNHKEYFAESTEAYFGVNDFYPFVRAELKHHDPSMYELMESIWGEVP